MNNIRTYHTPEGWVVSDEGAWLPGVFESEETARMAASLSDKKLLCLSKTVNVIAARPISMEDLLDE